MQFHTTPSNSIHVNFMGRDYAISTDVIGTHKLRWVSVKCGIAECGK